MPPKESDEPAVVVGRAYDFTLWLLPKVERFSRSDRFSVGHRLVATTLDLLLLLVEASYTTKKTHLFPDPSVERRRSRLTEVEPLPTCRGEFEESCRFSPAG